MKRPLIVQAEFCPVTVAIPTALGVSPMKAYCDEVRVLPPAMTNVPVPEEGTDPTTVIPSVVKEFEL